MRWSHLLPWNREIVHWDVPEGQYGLCDRLRGLACGLAWAEGVGRPLHYGWHPNDLCPAEFRDLFEPPLRGTICSALRSPGRGDLVLRVAANPLPHHFWSYLRSESLPNGGFRSLGDFRQHWQAHLRQLRPVRMVRQSVAKIQRRAGNRSLVGIHLRRTDVLGCGSKPEINVGNADVHDRALLAQIRMILEQRRDVCFFLASDSEEYFRTWAAMLREGGIPFVFHDKNWTSAFRQTSATDALVDLWMLGKCSLVVGSVRSGFLTISEALGAEVRLLAINAPAA